MHPKMMSAIFFMVLSSRSLEAAIQHGDRERAVAEDDRSAPSLGRRASDRRLLRVDHNRRQGTVLRQNRTDRQWIVRRAYASDHHARLLVIAGDDGDALLGDLVANIANGRQRMAESV